MLVLSAAGLMNGRLGLPEGDDNESLGFVSTLAGESGPGRVLMVGAESGSIPGEARPGPGFWYRTLDGAGTTIDEVWLPEERPGDEALHEAIDTIASGAELRPGRLLSAFAIDWVVLTDAESPMDDILASQLDLVPVPLAPEWKVYENPVATPLASGDDDLIWTRDGAGFAGPNGGGRVSIRVNRATGWEPDAGSDGWYLTVSAGTGAAAFAGAGYLSLAPYLAAGLFALGMILILWGRLRR